jgi:D-alanine transaminase
VITREDIRWLRCDIKSISLLPNTMLYNQAVEAGAGECILIRNGLVTEATHSSVLAVKNGKVITHPLSNLILPGITRKVILELCQKYNIEAEERALAEKEFMKWMN